MSLLIRLAFIVLCGIGLWGCSEEWNWKQKLTVSVQTPEGIKTASSVQLGTIVRYGWWQRQWGYGGAVVLRGEAVALEVAPGMYLFALINSTPSAWTVFFDGDKAMDEAGPKLMASRAMLELEPRNYPVLVTFADKSKPESVIRVDPDRLDAAFSAGHRLISISMTMTDEPVTDGVVQRLLPWLSSHPEPKLSPATGRSKNIPFSRQVSHGDFIIK
jgi:hypothetical protein